MGDYRALLADVHAHLVQGQKLAEHISLPKGVKRIIHCGMGNSAVCGDLLALLLKPYEIECLSLRDYSVPKYLLQPNTLVIVNSYSGNTPETLACYKSVAKEKVKCLVVTSGGTLLASAHRQKLPCIHLPNTFIARQCLYIQLSAIIQSLVNNKIIPSQATAYTEFKRIIEEYPFARRSNTIAKNMDNNFPLLYTSPDMYCTAVRWQNQIAENAKTLSSIHSFTELNHNMIEGFDNHVKGVSIFVLKHEREAKPIAKHIEVFVQLVRSQVDVLKTYTVPGRSLLASLLSGLYLGDWVSYQLAEMKNKDPDVVTLKNQLKEQI